MRMTARFCLLAAVAAKLLNHAPMLVCVCCSEREKFIGISIVSLIVTFFLTRWGPRSSRPFHNSCMCC